MSPSTPSSRPRIAALIAAHDEEAHVGGVIAGLAPYRLDRILVVDDNSEDATARVAREAGAEVLSLTRPEGGGKGQALRQGLAALQDFDGGFILFIDGDGQHDPKDFQGFLDYLEVHPDADFLIGSRFQDRAIIPKARWRTNALGSWTLGRIAGVHWEDSQSGFRLIRKKVLDRLELRSEGFAIEMEISMKASDWKLHWAHVPIQAIYHGGKSHFRGALDTWLIAWFSLQC